MNEPVQERSSHVFAAGLVAGVFVGVGLVLWFAPRMLSELGQRMSATAKNLDVADAVARGAHKTERFAAAAKSDRSADATPAADGEPAASRQG